MVNLLADILIGAIEALNHPVRREILRILKKEGVMNFEDLKKKMKEENRMFPVVSYDLNYHLTFLQNTSMIRYLTFKIPPTPDSSIYTISTLAKKIIDCLQNVLTKE